MTSETKIITGSITPTSALGIAFIILKLVGTISWSWWWVLSPFWIPLIIVIATLIVCVPIALFNGNKDVEENKEEPKEEAKEEVKNEVKEEVKEETKKKSEVKKTVKKPIKVKKDNENSVGKNE